MFPGWVGRDLVEMSEMSAKASRCINRETRAGSGAGRYTAGTNIHRDIIVFWLQQDGVGKSMSSSWLFPFFDCTIALMIAQWSSCLSRTINRQTEFASRLVNPNHGLSWLATCTFVQHSDNLYTDRRINLKLIIEHNICLGYRDKSMRSVYSVGK